MIPATIIGEARADGFRFTLFQTSIIKVAGDGAPVTRWLVNYFDRNRLRVLCAPPVACGEIKKRYADAVVSEAFTPVTLSRSFEPIPDLTQRRAACIRVPDGSDKRPGRERCPVLIYRRGER